VQPAMRGTRQDQPGSRGTRAACRNPAA
jgi:hypothetical protein